VDTLSRRRHEVLRLTRGATDPKDPRLLRWDPALGSLDPAALDVDAVVHLAGEGIAQGRWNAAVKQRLRDSRVGPTRLLVAALAARPRPPKVFLAASAVGYYGDRGAADLDESSPQGADFLAGLCGEWERESLRAAEAGMRTVVARFGLILGPDGGVLRRLLLPFRLGLGGRLGSGRQWISWIAVDDAVRAVEQLLGDPGHAGVYNLTSPNPVTNAQFTQSLGRTLNRPAPIPLPGFALRLAYGEMATALLLAGQKAHPARLKTAGFKWELPYVGEAMNHILKA
jgi:hypothetical protein